MKLLGVHDIIVQVDGSFNFPHVPGNVHMQHRYYLTSVTTSADLQDHRLLVKG